MLRSSDACLLPSMYCSPPDQRHGAIKIANGPIHPETTCFRRYHQTGAMKPYAPRELTTTASSHALLTSSAMTSKKRKKRGFQNINCKWIKTMMFHSLKYLLWNVWNKALHCVLS